MTWVFALGLAAAAFAAAVSILRVPRPVWSVLGAVLLLGLAGYAAQGSPELPGAPREAGTAEAGSGEALVAARRIFYGADRAPSRAVITADAFARRGRWASAAGFLSNAVEENPRDAEAWAAMGIALLEQARGAETPAARLAFARAVAVRPATPAPAFFRGLARLRSGDPLAARTIWSEALAQTPAAEPGRAFLAEQLAGLDALLRAAAAAGRGPAAPQAAPAPAAR